VRLLAVTTRQRSRLPALDRLPTIAETLGSDFDHSLWQAIYAPARVPASTLGDARGEFRQILASMRCVSRSRTSARSRSPPVPSGGPGVPCGSRAIRGEPRAMKAQRRRLVAGVAALAMANAVRAQSRAGPIRLVVGFNAGGSIDKVARTIVPELSRQAGRSAIVENVPGANSARAIARVAASDPNGDTLLVGSSALAHPDNAAGTALLRPVVLASTMPMVLIVRASMPVHDPASFANTSPTIRARPYGSSGIGNATHPVRRAARREPRHRGDARTVQRLVAGRSPTLSPAASTS
jgi:tripartite-type tricarboxylate transporter receptor subunit TctC